MSDKARLVLATAVLCLLSACAGNPHDQARNFAVAAVLADAASTQYKIGEGCLEGNSLYGEGSDKHQILLVNLLVAGTLWWVADELKEIDGPTWPIWVAGAFRAGVATHNVMQDCD